MTGHRHPSHGGPELVGGSGEGGLVGTLVQLKGLWPSLTLSAAQLPPPKPAFLQIDVCLPPHLEYLVDLVTISIRVVSGFLPYWSCGTYNFCSRYQVLGRSTFGLGKT